MSEKPSNKPEDAKTRYDKKKPPLGHRVTPERREKLDRLAKEVNLSSGALLEKWIHDGYEDFKSKKLTEWSEGFDTGKRNSENSRLELAVVRCWRCLGPMTLGKENQELLRSILGKQMTHRNCPPKS